MLTLLYFAGQLVAQAVWRTPYSLIDNRVSDLGNTECGRTLADTYICSPLHAVMNATFVLTGVLILNGLFLTRSMWPRRRLTTWGLILLGVAGAGTILVGLSPENVNVLFHLIGALNIPAGNAAMILFGLVIWRDRGGPPRGASAVSGAIKLAWFSVLSGVIGFLGLLSGPILVILTGHGGGLAERIALYPLIIWLIVFGYAILAKKVRASDMSESIQKRRSPTISADGLVADLELPARPR
ncbi:MAG TPA: DUF998 domain-containing protein, partial [Propionibacteriaceae bacterium]|nr:DUF998 domain-containing protein [Propionibacteriaceae bacterium]